MPSLLENEGSEMTLEGMHWNHRVIQDLTDKENITWGIYEVHYNGERPVGFGEPVKLLEYPDLGDNPMEALGWTIEHLPEALKRPHLTWDGVKLHGK